MYLWVLKDNPAAGFYQHMGGIKGAEKRDEIGGIVLEEDLYYWEYILWS